MHHSRVYLLLACTICLPLLPLLGYTSPANLELKRIEMLTSDKSCSVRITANRDIRYWRLSTYPSEYQFKIRLEKGKSASEKPEIANLNQEGAACITETRVENRRGNIEVLLQFNRLQPMQPLQSVDRIEKGILLEFGPGEASSSSFQFSKRGLGDWRSFVNIVARPGIERSIWETEFYWPVWQNDLSLIYMTLRAQQSDQDTEEYNGGFAYRRVIGDSAVFGTYLLYDTFSSVTDNKYKQITTGAEYLSKHVDVRVNYYKPDDDENVLVSAMVNPGTDSVVFNGDDIQIAHSGQTTMNMSESALSGYDISLGTALPRWLNPFDESRLSITGFKFEEDLYEPIKGKSIGYETRIYDVNWLGDDSRITMGVQRQEDDVREAETFVFFKLTIPLGRSSRDRSKINFNDLYLYQRMQDPVIRDIDIISQSRSEVTTNPTIVEDALDPATGERLRDIYLFAEAGASGTGTLTDPSSLSDAAANAAPGQTIVLRGDSGGFIVVPSISCPGNLLCNSATAANMDLVDGVSLVGAGGSTMILTATSASGYNADYILPGVHPMLEWNDNGAPGAAEPFFNLSGNNMLAGVDFIGSNQGSVATINIANNAAGINITNIVFRNTIFNGIRAENNASYDLSNITFQTPNAALLGSFTAISIGNNNTGTLDAINVNANGDLTSSGIVIDNSGNFTIRNSVFNSGVGIQMSSGNPSMIIENNIFDSQPGGFAMAVLGDGDYQMNNNSVNSDFGFAITASPILSGSGNTFSGNTLCVNSGTPNGNVQFDAGTCP